MFSIYNALKENSRKLLLNISLLVFLCFPATALLQEYLNLAGVIIYVAMVFISILVILRFEKLILAVIEKWYMVLIGLIVIGLVVVFTIVYPLETAGRLSKGSDRDEALNMAVAKIVEGQYPYYEKTPIGGPITPLPGAILLAAPFVALGNSAYQNLFWLLIFLYTTGIYLNNKFSALLIFVIALLFSPSVQYEFISGGDLLANSIYIIVFTFLTVRAFSQTDSSTWLKLSTAIILGVSLASRPNFFTLLPLLFVLLMTCSGKCNQVK